MVTAKQKRTEHRARRLFGYRIRHIACALENGMARVEHIDPVLREITGAHIMSKGARSMLHLQYSGQQFEKSRFSSSIRPDKHRALTALGLKLHSAINNHIAVGMIDVLQRDHTQ